MAAKLAYAAVDDGLDRGDGNAVFFADGAEGPCFLVAQADEAAFLLVEGIQGPLELFFFFHLDDPAHGTDGVLVFQIVGQIGRAAFGTVDVLFEQGLFLPVAVGVVTELFFHAPDDGQGNIHVVR